MAQLTEGLKVEWVADNGGGQPGPGWALIPDVKEIPTLVGAPSTHDVTTLYDKMKVYIEGLPDNGGVLAFKVFFTPELFAAYDKMVTAQKSDDIWFKVSMPAPLNKAYQFSGTVAFPANEAWGADAPMEGTLNVTATSTITLVPASPEAA